MRYIKKQQTPQKFSDWKAQANEAWQPFWNSKATNFQKPEKESVHKSLLKEQGYICCYCQRRIDLKNSHIEHFKPKDYYPKLSLEYTIAFFIMVRYVFEDEKRGKKGHHNSSNE